MEMLVENGVLTLRGNTYRYKEQLKRLGFTWDWHQKAWVSRDSSTALQRVVQDVMGATTTTTAEPTVSRISYGTYQARLEGEATQPQRTVRVLYEGDDDDDDERTAPVRRVIDAPQRRVKRYPASRHMATRRAPLTEDEEVGNFVQPVQVEVYSGFDDEDVSSMYDNDFVGT